MTALVGGGVGLLFAMRSKSFQGATGWSRYVGAVSVGWTFGAHTGKRFILNEVWHAADAQRLEQEARMKAEGWRLQQDKALWTELPMLGKCTFGLIDLQFGTILDLMRRYLRWFLPRFPKKCDHFCGAPVRMVCSPLASIVRYLTS
ncbi:hypothetical protein K469DRAFT_122877 [Zopfia rhizophila CBS 207.26]|uniref:Uncharacterized protein n=1 Tax=Zopfia rhizophila CBS 207.26 TaxID=1314779 RepID=A0A6A6EAB0_9PEZI|nr:hypothetical protein K469DRAFT_122877 [Zopfia rhizophila CBS 207.26]